jgi:hypothetical protein
VDQAAAVGVVQGLGHRGHQGRRFRAGGPGLPQPDPQVRAGDELGYHVAEAVGGAAHVVDGHDAGVVQGRQGAGLGQVGLDVGGRGDAVAVRHLDAGRPLSRGSVGTEYPKRPAAFGPDYFHDPGCSADAPWAFGGRSHPLLLRQFSAQGLDDPDERLLVFQY